MARDGFGSRRAGARRRWALVVITALAIALAVVACGGGGGTDGAARWDTAVWGSARWAP